MELEANTSKSSFLDRISAYFGAGEENTVVVSIFKVPHSLCSTKPEAYIPREIGLGPYHHLRSELQHWQMYKLVVAKRILKEFKTVGFEKLVDLLQEREFPSVRARYNTYLDMENKDLARIMAIDGLFLLDLLCFYSKDVLSGYTFFRELARSGAWRLAKDSIVRDAMTLENQIPMPVMKVILIVECTRLASPDNDGDIVKVLHDIFPRMLLKFCETISPLSLSKNYPKLKTLRHHHLLALLYHLIILEDSSSNNSNEKESSNNNSNEGQSSNNNSNEVESSNNNSNEKESSNNNSNEGQSSNNNSNEGQSSNNNSNEAESSNNNSNEKESSNNNSNEGQSSNNNSNEGQSSNNNSNEAESSNNNSDEEEIFFIEVTSEKVKKALKLKQHKEEKEKGFSLTKVEEDSSLGTAQSPSSVSASLDDFGPKIIKAALKFVAGLATPFQTLISTIQDLATREPQEDVLVPRASKLFKARVKFCQNIENHFRNIYFESEAESLYLPVISLNVNSEIIIRNLVVYETMMESESKSHLLTRYLELMSGLIHTSEDVKVLTDCKIIKKSGSIDDEEIAKIFNEMGKPVNLTNPLKRIYDENDPLEKAIKDINSYYDDSWAASSSKFFKKLGRIAWKLFKFLAVLVIFALFVEQSFCSFYDCSASNHLKYTSRLQGISLGRKLNWI